MSIVHVSQVNAVDLARLGCCRIIRIEFRAWSRWRLARLRMRLRHTDAISSVATQSPIASSGPTDASRRRPVVASSARHACATVSRGGDR